jgi:hypothetical protein
MAETGTRTERQEQRSLPNLFSPEFSGLGINRLEEFLGAQAEFIGMIGTMNQQWCDRMQSEAKLASEFALNLTTSRSVPDAMTACQEWTSRWLGLVAEDGRHLLEDTQKCIEAGRHLQSKSWLASPAGGST